MEKKKMTVKKAIKLKASFCCIPINLKMGVGREREKKEEEEREERGRGKGWEERRGKRERETLAVMEIRELKSPQIL
jgi:hypothetical protein